MTLTTAVNAVRALPVFRNTSARLVSDLIDRVSAKQTRRLPADGTVIPALRASLLIVLAGEVEVLPPAALAAAARMVAGPVAPGVQRVSAGDAFLLDDVGFTDESVGVRAVRGEPARVLFLTRDDLKDAVRASFALRRSVGVTMASVLLDLELDNKEPPPDVHRIWVCQEPGLDVPLAGLAHGLGAAIAAQFDEGTALATFDDAGLDRVLLWRDQEFRPISMAVRPEDTRALVRALNQVQEKPFYHIVYVTPSPPNAIPAAWNTLRFDRIVFLTSRLPTTLPVWLESRLDDALRNTANPANPYYTSVIPTIVSRRGPRRGSAGPSDVLRRLAKVAARVGTATVMGEPIPDEIVIGSGADKAASAASDGRRLRRDLCRLSLDLDAVRRLARPPTTPNPSGVVGAGLGLSQEDADALARLARAITNRQVGLALSGGGASSYRLVRFVKRLRGKHVPIDLVSGCSGGTLFAAYYCKEGVRGLRWTLERAAAFQACFAFAVFHSACIEWLLDYDLDGARIEDLDVRLVPLATALKDGPPPAPPRPYVLTEGTLGEAVRASGSLPGLVAPTDKGATRYTDGSISSPLPASVLKHFGADVIFACNSVPGPDRRNPLDLLPFGLDRLGRLLYRRTPLGRLIDVWVSGAFFLKQASAEAAHDADRLVQAADQAAPLIEVFCFVCAKEIAGRWTRADLDHDVQQCVDRWTAFASAPKGPP